MDQLKAIRDANDTRLSEHEHIRARINDYLNTLDPVNGVSPVTHAVYQRMHTLTIPRDMAVIKTRMDMQIRGRLRAAIAAGDEISDAALIQIRWDVSVEASVQRMLQARDEAIAARNAAGQSLDGLNAITEQRILTAVALQINDLHVANDHTDIRGRSQTRQRNPIADATDTEVDEAVESGAARYADPPSTQRPSIVSRGLRVAGPLLAALGVIPGAIAEANESERFALRRGRGRLNASVVGAITFGSTLFAGVGDEVLAVGETAAAGFPFAQAESGESHGSGVLQHATGRLVRGLMSLLYDSGL